MRFTLQPIRVFQLGVLALNLFFAVSCGTTGVDGDFPGLGDELPPASMLPPQDKETLPPSSNGSNPGAASPSANEYPSYPTTTGGRFTISRVASLELGTSDSFMGMASDEERKYILIKRAETESISRWQIYERPLLGDESGQYALTCSILDDGKFRGSLAIDNDYFYVLGRAGSYSSPTIVRRFSRLSCAEHSAIDMGEYSLCLNTFSLSVQSEAVISLEDQSGCKSLRIRNRGNGVISNQTIQSTIGGKTLGVMKLFASSPSSTWVVEDYSYPARLWKFDSFGRGVGWAEMPSQTYSDLGNYFQVRGLSLSTENLLLLSSYQTSGTKILRTYYIDVSSF